MDYGEFSSRLQRALNDRSDRACVVAVVAWIDHLIGLALQRAAVKRPKSLAARIGIACQAHLIDRELADDLHALRLVRNEFAHSVTSDSLDDVRLEDIVNSLKVPNRVYEDWGRVRGAATTTGGVVLYTEGPSPEAIESLSLGRLTFRMGVEVILAILIGSLQLEIQDGSDVVRFTLADDLRKP